RVRVDQRRKDQRRSVGGELRDEEVSPRAGTGTSGRKVLRLGYSRDDHAAVVGDCDRVGSVATGAAEVGRELEHRVDDEREGRVVSAEVEAHFARAESHELTRNRVLPAAIDLINDGSVMAYYGRAGSNFQTAGRVYRNLGVAD